MSLTDVLGVSVPQVFALQAIRSTGLRKGGLDIRDDLVEGLIRKGLVAVGTNGFLLTQQGSALLEGIENASKRKR